jgi:hypothetical protein
VPNRWAEDPSLASWIHNQRTNKKKLDRSDASPGMTAARAAKLEALGFAWDVTHLKGNRSTRRRGGETSHGLLIHSVMIFIPTC